MKKMGVKGIKDELAILMTAVDTNAINFEQTVRQMGKLNPKIKLMMSLQQNFIKVRDIYAFYVDSSETLDLTDEKRR